jgi:hypothetical protein
MKAERTTLVDAAKIIYEGERMRREYIPGNQAHTNKYPNLRKKGQTNRSQRKADKKHTQSALLDTRVRSNTNILLSHLHKGNQSAIHLVIPEKREHTKRLENFHTRDGRTTYHHSNNERPSRDKRCPKDVFIRPQVRKKDIESVQDDDLPYLSITQHHRETGETKQIDDGRSRNEGTN